MAFTRAPLTERSAQGWSSEQKMASTTKRRYGKKASASNHAVLRENFDDESDNRPVLQKTVLAETEENDEEDIQDSKTEVKHTKSNRNRQPTNKVNRSPVEREPRDQESSEPEVKSDPNISASLSPGVVEEILVEDGRATRRGTKNGKQKKGNEGSLKASQLTPETSALDAKPDEDVKDQVSSPIAELDNSRSDASRSGRRTRRAREPTAISIHSDDSRVQTTEEQPAVQRRTTRRKATTQTGLEKALDALTISDKASAQVSSAADLSPPTELPADRKHLLPLLQESNQKQIETFHDWAEEIVQVYDVIKIAEGSYGEVFKIMDRNDGSSARVVGHSVRALGGCIMKVIPINALSGPGSRKFSHARDVVKEVQMLKAMDAIHGFARFRDVYVLEGRMADSFIDAWKLWKANPENDSQLGDPSDSSSYSKKQMWAVVEMDDAGTDLEMLKQPSLFQVYDVFWSVTLSLAYGEFMAEFEHRDLHIGNICYRPRVPGGLLDIDAKSNAKMNEIPEACFGLSNIQTSIIDYTLSRAVVDHGDATQDGIAWTAFKGVMLDGDDLSSEEICQQKAGRRMVQAVELVAKDQGKSSSPQKWREFVPRTNVVWLSYLLAVMLSRAEKSATYLPQSSDTSITIQKDIRARLLQTSQMLELTELRDLPDSATALKDLALIEGWLKEEDVEIWKIQCNE